MKSSPAADAGVRARGHHQDPANRKPVPPAAPAPPAAPVHVSEAFKLATTRTKPWKQVSETSFLSHLKVPPQFSLAVVHRHGNRGGDVTTGSSCLPAALSWAGPFHVPMVPGYRDNALKLLRQIQGCVRGNGAWTAL